MSVLDETNRSIRAAIDDGTLDPKISAGPIAAVRRVAEQLDNPYFPLVAGDKLDNVSLPTYLKYCTELRLTPASRVGLVKEEPGGKLAKLRSVDGGKAAKPKRGRSA